MDFTIHISDRAIEEEPELLEYLKALQMMANRMDTSHFKYGNMADKYPESATGIGLCKQRLDAYENGIADRGVPSGNREYNLDAANGAVIEFLYPSLTSAYLETRETKSVSPGLAWRE